MDKTLRLQALAVMSALVLVGCGGDDNAPVAPPPPTAPTPPSPPPPPPPPPPPSAAERAAAATSTAQNNALCTAIQPFYWEVGDTSGALVSGSLGTSAPSATTNMQIASASKWLYSSYVLEKKGNAVDSAADVPFLNFTSGYSNFNNALCLSGSTVDGCLIGGNDSQDAAEAAGKQFHYNGGHMQKHASLNGLGPLDDGGLANELMGTIGGGFALSYREPQLAGGGETNAANYALFLRRLLAGSSTPLLIGAKLGTDAVCTLPSNTCNAVDSPIPEAWHYSLGHWVEDDAGSTPPGDGAFSSGGAFGFYPWIDSTRTYYGIIARENLTLNSEGYESAQCGRLIRLAYTTGTAQ